MGRPNLEQTDKSGTRADFFGGSVLGARDCVLLGSEFCSGSCKEKKGSRLCRLRLRCRPELIRVPHSHSEPAEADAGAGAAASCSWPNVAAWTRALAESP